MKNKKIIKTLIQEIFKDNNNKKIKFYTTLRKEKNKIRVYKKFIFFGKKKFLKFICFFFYLIIKNKKFKKNIFLIFEFDNLLIGHNLLPDWPGNYSGESIKKNIYIWLKYFFNIIINYKKLVLLLIELDNDYAYTI